MSVHSMNAVSATLNGQKVDGWGDGDDALTIETNVDEGELLVGAGGSSIFSQSSDRSAKITLKLLPTSPTHRLLMQMAAKQRRGTPSPFPFSSIDRINNEGGSTDKAFIQKVPNTQKGKNASVREWILVTGNWEPNIPTSL